MMMNDIIDVSLSDFGIFVFECGYCKSSSTPEEIEIESIKSHHPMCFDVDWICPNCEQSQKSKFRIKEILSNKKKDMSNLDRIKYNGGIKNE